MKNILIGGAVIAVLAVVSLVVCGVIWLANAPEGGVRLANEMEEYARDYLQTHDILEPGEDLVAYYDATVSMDGTEAAILTTKRVIYHNDGHNDAVRLEDIEDIQHREEALIGDVFEIYARSGKVIKIEVAPLNNGQTFKNVLMKKWKAPAEE